jgi:Tol biopolymer transport system component
MPLGKPWQLTSHRGSEAIPRLSPDGETVFYCRVVDGQRDIWMVPLSGGTPRELRASGSADFHPVVSPTMDRLAFVSDRAGGTHIWVAPFSDGGRLGDARPASGGDAVDMHPEWSPDGGRLAFIRSAEVWVMDPDNPESARQLTRGAGARTVRWDSQGKEVWVSGTWGGSQLELRRVSLAIGAATEIVSAVEFGDVTSLGLFSVDADARFVVHERADVRGDIWVMEIAAEGR